VVVHFPNRRFDALVRAEENLEERLLSIENSRFFRLLRLPGRLFQLWKAALDQYVWHSPLRRLGLRAAARDLCLRAREAGYEVVTEPAALLRHHECQSRWPWIRLSERLVWEERWAKDLKDDDPFYSPRLTKTREDATLDLESGGDLAPRKAAVRPGLGEAGW